MKDVVDRIAKLEAGHLKIEQALAGQDTTLAVHTTMLKQTNDQNIALLRDQRQVLTMVSAIEAIIKTGSMFAALVKWIAAIVVAFITFYAAFKAMQSGDFTAFLRIGKE